MTIIITPSNGEEKKFSTVAISELLHHRLRQYGLSEKKIDIKTHDGRITIELTGVDDTTRISQLIKYSGFVEIREAYSNADFFIYLENVNELLKPKYDEDRIEMQKENPLRGGIVLDNDSAHEDQISPARPEIRKQDNPLYKKLNLSIMMEEEGFHLQGGAEIGYCLKKDTADVMKLLRSESVINLLPPYVRFCWSGLATHSRREAYYLYAINNDTTGTRFLAGDFIKNARTDVSGEGENEIDLELNDYGRFEFYLMTKSNIDKYLAILIDGKVITAPKVTAEVKNGKPFISGRFDKEEAADVANILQSGSAYRYTAKAFVH